MFAVDDTIARLGAHGAEPLGDVAQYEAVFRLCYLRGHAGIIVALAEQIGCHEPAARGTPRPQRLQALLARRGASWAAGIVCRSVLRATTRVHGGGFRTVVIRWARR